MEGECLKTIIIIIISIMLCSCSNIEANVDINEEISNKIEFQSEEQDGMKLYLSVIAYFPFASGDMIEEKETEYVVDIYKVESGEKANIDIAQFLPSDSAPEKWPSLSKSTSRTLVSHYDGKEMVLKVYDFTLKENIFSVSFAAKSEYMNPYHFLPELDKYIIKENKDYYLVEVMTGIKKRIENIDSIDFSNIVYSPDEKNFACVAIKEGINYITVYNFDSMKQIYSIEAGEELVYLSDWGSDNRIYYNCGLNGYSISIDGDNKMDLGKFVFYPILSPDGKYLAYSRPDDFRDFYNLGEIEEYSDLDRGVYLLDMTSPKSIYLVPYIDGASTIPIKFFYR